jgi:hypothetical protein
MCATYGPELFLDVGKNNWHVYTTYKEPTNALVCSEKQVTDVMFKQEGPKLTW